MSSRLHVKICGLRDPRTAAECVRLGASSIGINFVASSPRAVDAPTSRAIAAAARDVDPKVVIVGVVADMSERALRELVRDGGLDCLQLHGDEPPDALVPHLPHAYKAVRIATEADVVRARTFPGDHLLVDAKVEGLLGGSGTTFDWALVRALATERKLTLAGGLTPDNVARAVAEVRPYCVDVASGVESSPGVKDLTLVRAFIEAAQR